MHMVVTAVALRFAARAGFVEPKVMDRGALLRFSILNGISIGFLNLSLGFNSVGFYQVSDVNTHVFSTDAMHATQNRTRHPSSSRARRINTVSHRHTLCVLLVLRCSHAHSPIRRPPWNR